MYNDDVAINLNTDNEITLDRSKPIEAKGRDIIERRVEEILKYPDERIPLESFNWDKDWEQLIAFAKGKHTTSEIDNLVIAKSRKIINEIPSDGFLKRIETYETGTKISVEIERCAQIYVYVRGVSMTIDSDRDTAASRYLSEYRQCAADRRGYIIDNYEKARKNWEGRTQSSNQKEIEEWKDEYIYSFLMATVFKCALKIDPDLANDVRRLNENLERSEDEYRNVACVLGTYMLCCTSNEDTRLLDNNTNNRLRCTICVTASVIITITALALGFGLGLGLGQ